VGLRLRDSQPFRHLVIQKSLTGAVGLHPFPINYKLRNGSLARLPDHFIGGAWSGFDVDFLEGNLVFVQKALGEPAVRAPEGGVENHFHRQGWIPRIALDYLTIC
jgi:hypothetical protein